MPLKSEIYRVNNFLSTITFRKVKNAAHILFSYYSPQISEKAKIKGKPFSISFEPTTSCNLRCTQCPSGLRSFSRPTGMLDTSLFNKVIDELKSDLIFLIFYFQGEPYLNTDFLKMVSYATKLKVYTTTSTNGHYLTDENCKNTIESGLKELIISVDGTNQESYEKYRIGGNLEKVKSGIANLIKWKKYLNSTTPYITIQFIIFRHNEHEIKAIRKLAKTIGADKLQLKTAQIYDYENGSDLIPSNKEYSRYDKIENTYSIKNKLSNSCWRMWHSSVITWDGKVVPCCFDKDGSHQFGDLNKTNFKDVWNNGAYQNFRKSLLKSRKEIDICSNCSEGIKVKL